MDIFSQFSDPFPFGSNSMLIDKQEASLLSEGSSTVASGGASGRGGAHSDEEGYLLATSHPKKRAGRTIFKETRHPVFRGVRRRNGNKWVCEVREPNKKSRIWLGTYPTPEMAARAHDVAALALRGKSACLNFADSAWKLPVPVSNDARDIRRAASEAAGLFRPPEIGGSGSDVKQSCEGAPEDSSEACSDDSRPLEENLFYLDEEMVFDMPGLLSDMAEGLLLPPPHSDDCNLMENNAGDFSLWNY